MPRRYVRISVCVPAHCVSLRMTTNELVRYLNEREISGAPVVDSQGHFIGVVSMTDIGRHLAEPSDFASVRSEFYRDTGDELTLEDLRAALRRGTRCDRARRDDTRRSPWQPPRPWQRRLGLWWSAISTGSWSHRADSPWA